MRTGLKLLLLAAVLTACTNGLHQAGSTNAVNSSGNVGVVANPSATYRITQVTFAAPPSSSGSSSSSSSGGTTTSTSSVTPVTIYFDVTPPYTDFSTFCGNQSGATACNCFFRWSEINPNGTYTVTIPRYVENPLILTQPSLVQCNAPDNWYSQVPDGTTIQIGIKPATGLSQFLLPAFSYVKNPSATQGTFSDSQGDSFDNILHYSCYESFQKGNSIVNRTVNVPTLVNGAAGPPTVSMLANDFCIANVESGTYPTSGCPAESSIVDYSAESNYYNLYTRASDRGTINGNSNGGRYNCPVVQEPLVGGSQTAFWPLDSQFALALSPSASFPIAVEGFSKLSYGTDPTSQASTCYPTSSSSSGGSSGSSGSSTPGDTILTGCLGFASRPNPDGTCATFRDSKGNIQPQFRLRRFVSIYPPSFEADGQPFNQVQPTDVTYVVDRPVANPNGDPTKPFTMLGPKPCPFSYFDYKQVTATPPSYVGTNETAWTGKSYDGVQFPNVDSANSCSALIALPDFNSSNVSFGTVNAKNPILAGSDASDPTFALNQLWVRPTRPWAPHYEEDLNFQACAPLATPFKDAPLHFAKDVNNNVTWCAEFYPTQNGNVSKLDAITGTAGSVVPYTSHTVKGVNNPVACTATKLPGLPTGYPGNGPANHTGALPPNLGLDSATANAAQTCDRTIPASQDAFYRLALTESPAQVEGVLQTDPSFGCTITWDNGGQKRGVSTPAGGCCGGTVVQVVTGPTATNGASTAHLEPISDATTPSPCASALPAY